MVSFSFDISACIHTFPTQMYNDRCEFLSGMNMFKKKFNLDRNHGNEVKTVKSWLRHCIIETDAFFLSELSKSHQAIKDMASHLHLGSPRHQICRVKEKATIIFLGINYKSIINQYKT
jgi:hypothetical protein